MKIDANGTVAGMIARLEDQEKRVALLIQFPPSGCRSIAVWRKVQSDRLASVRESLGGQRELLAHLTSQSMLPLEFTDV